MAWKLAVQPAKEIYHNWLNCYDLFFPFSSAGLNQLNTVEPDYKDIDVSHHV